jgi:hypothetical protein
MPATARKIIATIVLLALVVVYGPLAMEIGARVSARVGAFGQLVYFVVAGLVWVLPAAGLIYWGWRGPKG